MKRFLFFTTCLLVITSCTYQQEQLHDRVTSVAPVLTIEGLTNFVITEDLPDYFYSILTWTSAHFGKGIPAEYILQVSNDETFEGESQSFPLGTDINQRALSATELYDWAVEKYGKYNAEKYRKEPATLYFRIVAFRLIYEPDFNTSHREPQQIYSNVASITSQWDEKLKTVLRIPVKEKSSIFAAGLNIDSK